jgi:hypothetical protein
MTDDMKKCKYCGREIGKDTNFCWYCGRELEARPERPDVVQPGGKPGPWLWIILAVLAVIVLLILVVGPFLNK